MSGRVVLVGAGPGAADLITLRGAAALAEADVVVYDRLVGPELLELAPSAERVYVGKEPGRGAIPQDRIGDLLVSRARAGEVVVRLKGGDPFVFGRGGEEVMACVEGGVPVEVIPGVTSATAAPASAGIPVTHRGVARSFAVVTASTAHGDQQPPDLAALARSVETLIILMGAARLEQLCQSLIAAGLTGRHPAAVVQWATTPDERTVIGTLSTLPGLAREAAIGPPATLVIGEVVSLAERLNQVGAGKLIAD
jgi:uroporphyrin-III C-methyltransferase